MSCVAPSDGEIYYRRGHKWEKVRQGGRHGVSQLSGVYHTGNTIAADSTDWMEYNTSYSWQSYGGTEGVVYSGSVFTHFLAGVWTYRLDNHSNRLTLGSDLEGGPHFRMETTDVYGPMTHFLSCSVIQRSPGSPVRELRMDRGTTTDRTVYSNSYGGRSNISWVEII